MALSLIERKPFNCELIRVSIYVKAFVHVCSQISLQKHDKTRVKISKFSRKSALEPAGS